MKKLYRKGTVHPSPPIISDHLAFLPAAILTLTAALTPEDREVLAYLISYSASNSPAAGTTASSRRASSVAAPKGGARGGSSSACGDHPPQFNCDCFRCYMSYWARWGSSPNRELIHEIIDAFEDELLQSRTKVGATKTTKKERRKQRTGGGGGNGSGELKRSELSSGNTESAGESESVQGHEIASGGGGGGGGVEGEEEVVSSEKGSVRRFVSFIGERIWGVWG